MRMIKLKFICIFFLLFLCTCAENTGGIIPDPIPPVISAEIFTEEEQAVLPEPEPEEHYLTIVAAGDNLFHNKVYEAYEKDGVYQFDPIYEEIKPFIQPADIAFINQETLLAGEEFGYSSYPRFNTPQALGKTLEDAGFDVISQANNHVMDKGGKAVIQTLNFWKTVPGAHILGIHESQESRENQRVIIEKNSIKTGFLAYTCFTNGLSVPSNMPYLVSLADKEIMAKEINALRPLCDILVVSMHWGNEYEHEQNTDQETWSAFLAEHLVDIVIGHHPHVLQPYKYIERTDGKQMLCFYSLGNFVSAQDQAPRFLGGLAFIKLKKDASGIAVEQAGLIPVITHFSASWNGFKVYPLRSYTEELLAAHWIKWKVKDINLEYFNQLADGIYEEELIKNNPFEER